MRGWLDPAPNVHETSALTSVTVDEVGSLIVGRSSVIGERGGTTILPGRQLVALCRCN